MLEYVVLIACLAAALLAMQVYIKRGMQGRLRQAVDELGQQYAPKNTESDTTLKYESSVETTVETKEIDGRLKATTTSKSEDRQERSGNEKVGDLDSPLF